MERLPLFLLYRHAFLHDARDGVPLDPLISLTAAIPAIFSAFIGFGVQR